MTDKLEIEAFEEDDISLEVTKPKKVTSTWMTKYEYTQLIGLRALQLSQGDPPRIEINGMVDIYEIAREELCQRKTPLSIKRTLLNGRIEVWKITDMNIRNY